jgi:hypothetical protein
MTDSNSGTPAAPEKRSLGRRLVGPVAVLFSLAAIALLVAVWVVQPAPKSNSACVVVAVPSTMGGTTDRACGAAAHRLCRSRGAVDRTVAEACQSQGFAADVPRSPSG